MFDFDYDWDDLEFTFYTEWQEKCHIFSVAYELP